MHYLITKFQKSLNARGSPSPAPIVVTKNCVIYPNLWFFKLVITKLSLKISVITSFQWRHRYYVT